MSQAHAASPAQSRIDDAKAMEEQAQFASAVELNTDGLVEADSELDDEDDDGFEEEEQHFSGMNEVMDQDWDILDGDLTKRFNRLKARVNASVVQRASTTTSTSSQDGPVIKPAMNTNAAQREARDASAGSTTRTNKVSEQLAQYAKYASNVNLDILQGNPGNVTRKGGSERTLQKDKSDRATNEQVLDPRTRLILFKMLGRGLISRIDGCVSTGKEANVYHSVSPEGRHIALKIFKTSILVFKDRDRYVTGEFRFKSGYARSNPRKMVRLWAEKELRNLRRMRTAGLRVPEAIEVRENVLVMDFLGLNEWQASPRLKDADIPQERFKELYIEMLLIARKIFAHCKLVHADLSEYNILWHEERLWVIDVSQSVEHDHPAAFDFLRSDLHNIDEFWAKRGVATLGVTASFHFVTSNGTSLSSDDEYITQITCLLDERETRTGADNGDAHRRAVDEAVFAQSYIPATLTDVVDPERDVDVLARGQGESLIYANITGIKDANPSPAPSPQAQGGQKDGADLVTPESDDADSSSVDSDNLDASESGGDSEERPDRPKGKKFEDKEAKKQRKREVREQARDKRTKKMSKSEKARRIKKSSGKR